MEKARIYFSDFDDERIVVEDCLRSRGQFNSFEDLIGMRIDDVQYDHGDIILTLESK